MDETKRPTVSLSETDMVSGRRAALRSMLAKTGIVAAAVVTAAVAATPAQAADRHNQTARMPVYRIEAGQDISLRTLLSILSALRLELKMQS